MKVAFYRGQRSENPKATLTDNLICWITGSRFSHVELAFPTADLDVFECWSASARDGGVRVKCMELPTTSWYIVDTDITVSDSKLISFVGRKYDYRGLISSVLDTPYFNSTPRWFCSEFVGYMLGIKRSYELTPEELFQRLTGASSQ